jgi:uncharacterized membrane protein
MFIEAGLLGATTTVVASMVAGAVLAGALASAPWRAWLADPERRWVWLAGLLLLCGLWSMRAGLTPGLSLRFLLVTTLTLLHGWQLAVIGGALVLLVLGLVGVADWTSFGPNLLCTVIVPALFTAWLHEQVHRRLPLNYFVYFFVTVFLGSALAYNLAGLSRLGLLAIGGTAPLGPVAVEYLPWLPFMSFGEGVTNGMFMAMMVVYRPRWVMSFDDRQYLARRGE